MCEHRTSHLFCFSPFQALVTRTLVILMSPEPPVSLLEPQDSLTPWLSGRVPKERHPSPSGPTSSLEIRTCWEPPRSTHNMTHHQLNLSSARGQMVVASDNSRQGASMGRCESQLCPFKTDSCSNLPGNSCSHRPDCVPWSCKVEWVMQQKQKQVKHFEWGVTGKQV